MGLGLGQRLNFISKKLILRYFWDKIAPIEKRLFKHASKSSALVLFYIPAASSE